MTSIAVLNVGSGLAASFSIHQMAERQGLQLDEIGPRYQEIERSMLDGFYAHVRQRPNDNWITWNMRDINYGFPAIEHRYSVLGGTPQSIPESHLLNLAEALPDIYGSEFVEHGERGRLDSLARLNGFEFNDFLSGKEEAAAFSDGEYVRLHQSTLRKVRLIHAIAKRAWDGKLRTRASWWQLHGGTAVGVIEDLMDHPIYKLVSFIFAVVGFSVTISRVLDLLIR